MSSDIIFIHGLTLTAIIGCLAWEKETPQPIIIDVDMYTDNQLAAQADDIKQTISYVHVAEWIKSHIEQNRYALVETLAEQLATLLLHKFSLSKITIKVNKPEAIAEAKRVGVIITRAQAGLVQIA